MLHTKNAEMAARYGLAALEETAATYHAAKRDHLAAYQRFSCRGEVPAAEDYEAQHEIDLYTSSATGTLRQYVTLPPKPDLRVVDRELLRRAEERRRVDLAEAVKVKPPAPIRRAAWETARFLQRCEAEYLDILELEAEAFKELARHYFDNILGDTRLFVYVEARARRMLEDIEHTIAMGLLGQLRQVIYESEERLILRGMGYYPYPATLRNHRRVEGEHTTDVLDSMYAVPLWSRVMAARSETENEESILHLRLSFAHTVQRDLTEDGYVHRRRTPGRELIYTNKVPPVYMEHALKFGFEGEKVCLEADEETERMRIVDEATAVYPQLFGELRVEEDKLIGYLVEQYGSKRGSDKIKRMFAFMHQPQERITES